MTTQHTPTPWTYETHDMGHNGPRGTFYTIRDGRNCHITTMENFDSLIDPDLEANTAFIVRACNAHEGLVEALRFYAAFNTDLGSRARAALAAAK